MAGEMGGERRDEARQGRLPPLAPPAPAFRMSVTRTEIDKYWRKRRWIEEDHFLAAIKAAARLRAAHFSEKDYMVFMESLEEEYSDAADIQDFNNINHEIRLGIKDWWTKSKYAYLNQPAVGNTTRPSRRSNYIPNKMVLYNYNYHCDKRTTTPAPAPLQPAYLGVF